MNKWIKVLRVGTFSDRHGSAVSIDRAKLDRIVDSYDPAQRETPIVIGHPRTDSPAFGWIEKFKRVGDDLFALPRQIIPEFAEAVSKGLYRYVSCAIRPDDTIRHIGFLGGEAPAVAGLGPVELSEDANCIELSEVNLWPTQSLFRNIIGVIRKWRDALVEKDGVEAADKIITQETLGWMDEMVNDIEVKIPPTNQLSEQEGAVDLKELEARVAELSQALATSQAKIVTLESEIAARDSKITQTEQAQRAHEFSEFCDGLIGAGKMTPAEKKVLVPIFERLHGAAEIELSEGEGDQRSVEKKSAIEYLKSLLAGLPVRVELSELATGKAVAQTVDKNDSAAILRAAQDYQLSEEKKGNTVSIAAAVEHVTKAGK